MSVIRFTVPSVPVAQPRARAAIAGGHARVYGASHKHPVHAFKAAVQMAAAEAYQGAPLDGPVCLEMYCVLPRPGKLNKKKANPPRYATSRPDIDNLMKSVTDALSGLIYRDDKQIAEVIMRKTVAAGNEQPHVCVEVYPLDDEKLLELWQDN